ncbi:MAG: hypothetical protein LBK12_05695 [Odoribacteraceae bacterium]|jgi:hypothetical protein|nr:hypothetical protein [Odoribacteraceae bacterium]
MAKKKVINHAQQQKLLAAQHKKAFMQKLREYCTMAGGDACFDLIPDRTRELVYAHRGASCKFRVAEGTRVTRRFVKILYTYVNGLLKREMMELLPGSGKMISLFDYYQIACPLGVALQSGKVFFAGQERFAALRDSTEERFSEYARQVTRLLHSACYAFCDLGKHFIYTFTYEIAGNRYSERDHDYRHHQIVTIGTLPLDTRHVTIEGERRLVSLVGELVYLNHNVPSVLPLEVPFERLRIPGAAPGEKATLYIQQHAIDRIMTRAYYGHFPGTVPMLISRSLAEEREIIPSGKDRYLIACHHDDLKIGYFLASHVDDLLIIRTFLLITHNGTPEGRRLEQLTGLQKRDKTFLALDDLRSLAHSDIIDDEDVRRIFIEAGCKSLLELCRRVRAGNDFDWLWDDRGQSKELSKMILEYIRLGNTDEEYFVNDD